VPWPLIHRTRVFYFGFQAAPAGVCTGTLQNYALRMFGMGRNHFHLPELDGVLFAGILIGLGMACGIVVVVAVAMGYF
jgi:hypothetical protein